MFEIDEKDFNRTHKEKRKNLVLTKKLPVAVLDLQTLAKLGTITQIPGVNRKNAVRLTGITNKALKNLIPEEYHIWINPKYFAYRSAWKKAGLKAIPRGQADLDHLHSKEWAKRQGYGYVILTPIGPGPNRSAGTLEKKAARQASPDISHKKPIFYGNHIHWAKMWNLRIDLAQE